MPPTPVLVMFAIGALLAFWAIFLVTPRGKALRGRAEANAEQARAASAKAKADKQRAYDAARTITGPGWSLQVADLDQVRVLAKTRAITAATITNRAVSRASFKVSVVLADGDNTRLGTIKASSDELAPGESQLLTIDGRISPLLTKTLGRMEFQVERY